jgi:uncharacterized membrane protein
VRRIGSPRSDGVDELHRLAVRSSIDPSAREAPNMIRLDTRVEHHPAVLEQWEKRREDVQLRIADQITAFAGSMQFVYLHILLFAVWMLVIEKSPWPTLTLIVSLEAIFLSTFVMIGQNRQAAFQQAKADSDYDRIDKLLEENTELTRLVHQLTQEVHKRLIGS